jgi:hypothetical protein
MPNVQDFRCNPGRKKRNTKEADKFTGNAPKKCED